MAKFNFNTYEDENILIEILGPPMFSSKSTHDLKIHMKNGSDFKTTVDDSFMKMAYIKEKVIELNYPKKVKE